MVYSRSIDGRELTFGISGRLYKSNVLLYDHQTESLWSQLKSRAVSGAMVGQHLNPIPSVRTRWGAWKKKHPLTSVLSAQTGYVRNYDIDPYEGYYRVGSLMFPVGEVRKDFSAKERVMGIAVHGAAKAYALERLRKMPGVINDRVGLSAVAIEVNEAGEVISVRKPSGEEVPHMFVYWFAWQAFYPRTEVFSSTP